MNRNERLIILINSCFSFVTAVSSVFVNMYLYRYLDGIAELTVFNLFQFGLMPIGFYAAGRWSRSVGKKPVLIAGLALFIVFYGLLIALGERSARFLYLLGAVNGIANGLYWFSFNIVIAAVTVEATRGRFFGLFGATGSIAGAAAPALSTLMLHFSPGLETGYLCIFVFIIILAAVMAFAAAALIVKEHPERFTVMDKLLPGKENGWRFAIRVNLIYGIRDGANWSILSVLVLKAAGSDVVAGGLTVVFALVGAAANLIGGRLLTARRGLSFWFWGAAAAIVSAVLLVAVPTPAGAVIAGSLWRAAEAFVLLPFNVAFFNVLADYGRREGNIAGRNIAVEIILNLGRTIGALAFLLASFVTPRYAEILFPLVTLALPASFFVYKRYMERTVE